MITWIKFCQSIVGIKKICIQFSKTKIIMFSNLGKKQNQENIANVSHLSGCRNFSRGHMIMLCIFKMQYRSISFERTNSHDHTIRGTDCSSIRAKTRFPPVRTPPSLEAYWKIRFGQTFLYLRTFHDQMT